MIAGVVAASRKSSVPDETVADVFQRNDPREEAQRAVHAAATSTGAATTPTKQRHQPSRPDQQIKDSRVVPAQFVVSHIKQFEGLKRFFLSLAFLCTYLWLNTLKVDWLNARDTESFYELARSNTGQVDFGQRRTITQQVDFLNTDLDRLTTELDSICGNCEVCILHCMPASALDRF